MCAADPLGTSTATARDFCEGDEGGPLLVPDGSSTGALGGIVSWHSTTACADPAHPGVYTQLTDGALNRWIHSKTPEADFDLSHQPRAGEPVTLTSTSRHPEGADYFTTFRWDLDNDGAFDDANGRSISHAFPTAGQAVAGLEASKPGGDKASIYYAFDVEPAPGGGTTTTTTPVVPTVAPPAKTGPVRHDPRRQAPEGEARPLPDPRPLRQDGAEGHRRDRGLPRRAPDRDRAHEGQARRDQARAREADAQRPPGAEPLVDAPPEDPRAGAGRPHDPAHEAPDDRR